MYKTFPKKDESEAILQNEEKPDVQIRECRLVVELKDRYFWRAVACELFATLGFMLCVTMLLTSINEEAPSLVVISFTVGLSLAVVIQIFGPLSGAHVNPAVSIGAFIKGDISSLKCGVYIVVQHVGAIIGTAITYGLIPTNQHGSLGSLVLNPRLSVARGFFIEMIFTMVLVLTVLASTSEDNGRINCGFSNALAIGVSVVIAHFICVPLTGCGINPCRAIGSAAVSGRFPDYFWIYWVAPLFGGIIVGVIYRFILAPEKNIPEISSHTSVEERVLHHDSAM